MIDQKFCINTEHPIKQFFIIIFILFSNRATCHISHRADAAFLQFLRIASSHAPEIRDRSVIPQKLSVRHLIKLGDTHSGMVLRNMFRNNIHRDLGKIKIGSDSRSRSNPGLIFHITDHLLRQLVGRHMIGIQIISDIHEYFINGIYMDVLWCNIF